MSVIVPLFSSLCCLGYSPIFPYKTRLYCEKEEYRQGEETEKVPRINSLMCSAKVSMTIFKILICQEPAKMELQFMVLNNILI